MFMSHCPDGLLFQTRGNKEEDQSGQQLTVSEMVLVVMQICAQCRVIMSWYVCCSWSSDNCWPQPTTAKYKIPSAALTMVSGYGWESSNFKRQAFML